MGREQDLVILRASDDLSSFDIQDAKVLGRDRFTEFVTEVIRYNSLKRHLEYFGGHR